MSPAMSFAMTLEMTRKTTRKTPRNLKLALGLLTAVTLAPAAAQADLWQGAPVQRPKQITVGAFGQLYFSPSDFQAFFNGMYGFTNRLQGELRMGVGTQSFYFGAFGKSHLVSTDLLSMSVWGGMHAQSVGFLDGSLILSHGFKTWELYFAPLLSLNLSTGTLGSALVPGFSLFVEKNLKVYVEGVLKLGNYYNAMSVGFRFFL